MRRLRLGARLLAVAELVPEGANVLDVGTDHGFIPVYLAQSGHTGALYAADVREGPLNAARENARAYGVYHRIRFILTDGLYGCESLDADAVIMAGMGGETILGILQKSAQSRQRRLIMQPQSKPELLRKWLLSSGYCITCERTAREQNRLYEIITAEAGAGTMPPYSAGEYYVGRVPSHERDAAFYEKLEQRLKKLGAAVRGLEKSRDAGDTNRLGALIMVRDDLIRMIGEGINADSKGNL